MANQSDIRMRIMAEATQRQSLTKRANKTSMSLPSGNKERTSYGYSVKVQELPGFTIKQEIISDGYNSGYKLNEEGDITFQVQDGMIFASLEDNGKTLLDTQPLHKGMFLHAKRGQKYLVATAGNIGASVLIIETPNYSATCKQITPPVKSMLATVPIVYDQATLQTQAVRDRSVDTITRRQAQAEAVAKGQAVETNIVNQVLRQNSVATYQTGTNLKPIIPTGDD